MADTATRSSCGREEEEIRSTMTTTHPAPEAAKFIVERSEQNIATLLQERDQARIEDARRALQAASKPPRKAAEKATPATRP